MLTSKQITTSSGATVGTDPATITGADDVSVVVPAGACPCDVTITITKIENPQEFAVPHLSSYDFGPSGIDFSEPVTITVPYAVADSATSPSAYWYDSLTGALSQQGITDIETIVLSSSLHALRFKTTHFTPFYLLAGGAAAAVGGGGGGGGGGGCSVSSTGRGNIVEFLVPYLGLAVVMAMLKRRDARNRSARNMAKGGDGTINQTTEYAYDRLGRQTSIIGYADPAVAQTTQYEYDDLDRIWKITYPDTNEITYQYNEAGRVTRRNDQQGIVTTYTYNGMYNMTAKYVDGNSVTDNAEETFTYDGLGRILTATKNVDGTQISLDEFTYNDIGKITATDVNLFDMGTKTIGYTYDQAGYRIKTSYPYGATLDVNVVPDWQGRIDTLKVNGSNRVEYKYIGSRVAQRKYLTFRGTLVQVSYDPTYDNLGRITSAPTIETYGTTSTITEFDYEYDPNTNDITKMTYDHRTSDPCTDFTYDDLSRLTQVDYGIEDNNEIFTIDDLGNRDNVNIRDGNDVDYSIDNLTNRYNSVGGNTLIYDAADNLIKDHNGYEYKYDYENRITKITKSGPTTVAEFAYDALGRRIKKRDSIADTNNIYFYNPDWQVICDYNDAGVFQRWFAYGNYVDEVLITSDSTDPAYYRWYVHDHLYSPVALAKWTGVVERYEYDAYGNCYILEPNFAPDPDGKSDYGNPYLFTGRRVDILDANSLKIQYNRNRYYDQCTGRWLTHDPLGIVPPGDPHRNLFRPLGQYGDGANLYEYGNTDPILNHDPWGLARKKVWEGTIYWSAFKPKDDWNKANNPRMRYKVEMWWDCIGNSKCPEAYYTTPEVTYQNLVGDIDSTGLSLVLVGATVSNYIELDGLYARARECRPRGRKCGTEMEVGFTICWRRRYSVGMNPGIGPWSFDFGLSWGFKDIPVRCTPTIKFIIDCCRLLSLSE
ncbi:MAG: hypothetical protein KAY65_02655 [Planctomycetes bacterium]|nr:hypothetical protein [Planctomycetota bacterium]